MNSGVDAKHFIHLPGWAKALCLVTLGAGVITSLSLVVHFLGQDQNRDWLLIGINGAQFLITTFVIAIVLFVSQTDANIGTLRIRAEQFLSETLPIALRRISLADSGEPALTVSRGTRSDIFGYDYELKRGDDVIMRLWCGVNVGRIIVIYRVIDPSPKGGCAAFVDTLKQVFAFSLGGTASVGYAASYEPLPGKARTVSIWLTVATQPDFLTDPAAKLFWSQDIAMMTESVLRTALREAARVRLDTDSRPIPL